MKAKWIWLIVVVALGSCFNPAEAATNNVSDGNRFLFIVETSSASSRLEHGGRQAAFDLIYTGVYGQMHAGDTFGLWTFNQIVFPGVYPMQTWNPDANMELATAAGQFLKSQHYEKKGQLNVALKTALSLIRGVKDVNIFIVSDPASRAEDLIGPGYTSVYEEKADEARESKKPVITTIIAKSGSISNWFVTVAGEPVRLPAFAIPERAIVKQQPTNTATQVAVAKPQAPRQPRPPIIIKRTTPAPDQATTTANEAPATLAADPQSSAKVETNSEPASLPATDSQQATANSAPVASVAKNSGAATIATPTQGQISNATQKADAAAPKTASVARALPPVVKVAARERSAVDPADSASNPRDEAPDDSSDSGALTGMAAPTVSGPSFSPKVMISIGGLLLLLAAVVTGLFLRHLHRPTHTSFISQSMERR